MHQGLEQLRRLAFDHLSRDGTHFGVVDSIFQPVGTAGFGQVRLELDGDLELLCLLALGGPHSVAAAERHSLENDPVHPAILALERLRPLVLAP